MRKLAGIIIAIGILPGYSMAAAVTFSDDFNRPDGPVGNGWTPWGNGADLLNGQLETFGQNAVAGGVGRALALTFPLSFGFDFRTLVPTGGGWEIGFNSPVSTNLAKAQVGFIQQCCGSSNVAEFYMTSGGQQFVNGIPSGTLENYSTTALAHISGSVNPDLSATITITYADNSQAVIAFGAPLGALGPQGSQLFFGNSSAPFGPHYFDNFVVSSAVPEPGTFSSALMAVVALAALRLFRIRSPSS